MADSGFENPNADWMRIRAEYDISESIKTRVQMDALRDFFLAVGHGRGYGFRFKDWNDYKITQEVISVGDGVKTVFQITKTYTFVQAENANVSTYTRKLTKIAWGTVAGVSVGGISKTSPTDYTVDETTGKITFVEPPALYAQIKIGYAEFHVPVRFDTDALSATHEFWETLTWPNIALVETRDWRVATGEITDDDSGGGGGGDTNGPWPEGATWYMHFSADTYFDGTTVVTAGDVMTDTSPVEVNGYRLDSDTVANEMKGDIADFLMTGEFTLVARMRWTGDDIDLQTGAYFLAVNNDDDTTEWGFYPTIGSGSSRMRCYDFNDSVNRDQDTGYVDANANLSMTGATTRSNSHKLAIAANNGDLNTGGSTGFLGGLSVTKAFLGYWDRSATPAGGSTVIVAWIDWIAGYPIQPASKLPIMSTNDDTLPAL